MSNWRKIVFFCFGFLFMTAALMAVETCPMQQQGNQKGRMAEFFEQKRAYLIREVGMTQEETNKFFPLYDELQKEKFKLHREVRSKIKSIQTAGDAVSDKEYREGAHAMNELKLKEARLDDEYYHKFEKILSPQKLYKLQIAESNFGREMMRRGSAHGDRKRGEGQER